jgi:CHAD domain-containing protein
MPSILTEEQVARLQTLVESEPQSEREKSDPRRRLARLLLLYDAGEPTRIVAATVGLSPSRARYWRRRCLQGGLPWLETPPVDPPSPPAPPPEPTHLERLMEHFSARRSPGLLAAEPLAEAGRKVIGYHFVQMLKHEPGTRLGEDPEELHDMRVATRRMRAAFEVFAPAFKDRPVRRLLKELRQAGRSLGQVRDLDVFIEKARHYQEGLPAEDQAGFEPVIAAWQAERSVRRLALTAYLDSRDYQRFLRDFAAFLDTPGAGARPLPAPAPALVSHTAPALIYERLGLVRGFEPLLEQASVEQLHALRIECKKLRYTLEFFREALGSQAKDVIEAVKLLQDHLGDLNDAVVATALLGEQLAGWEAAQLDRPLAERLNAGPLAAYLASRHAERHQLQGGVAAAWKRFNQPDMRLALAQAAAQL